jgi:hypothetical protein
MMKNAQGHSGKQPGNTAMPRRVSMRLIFGMLAAVSLISARPARLEAAGVEGPRRLAHWRFATPNWAGDEGQKPLIATNLEKVPSFNGSAARLAAGANGVLQYRLVEPDGRVNMDCARGAIRFFFKPDWTSAKSGGTGPGVYGRLVEVGDYTEKAPFSGLWGLNLTPDGNQITFCVQTNDRATTLVIGDIAWKSNTWHEVTFSYSPEETRLEVDAATPVFGAGMPYTPGPEVRAGGFRIGSARSGSQSACGAFDEVETFGNPSSPIQTWQNEAVFSAVIESSPPALHLYWRNAGSVTNTVQRRESGGANWTKLAQGFTGWDYRDTSVRPGVRYEYQLVRRTPWVPFIGGYPGLYAAIDAPPVERRGHVVLLVDETLAGGLKSELKQLMDDLAGDGWQVLRHDVARHNDADWPSNAEPIARIRQRVVSDHATAPQDDWCLYVLGHVAVPCSGSVNPDGHLYRPWPTDGYYADVSTPEKWTDTRNLSRSGGVANLPGDGRWDQNEFPSPLKMSFGRVDFSHLNALSSATPSGVKRLSELELTRLYLAKTHRYRTGQLTFANRVLIEGGFYGGARRNNPWYALNNYGFITGILNASRWFGLDPQTMAQADFFKANTPALLGVRTGYASASTMDEPGPTRISSELLAEPPRQPPVAFAILDGSFLGQWDLENNLPRTFLASANGGLGVVWARGTTLPMESLAMGEPIGAGVRGYLNNTNFFRNGGSIVPELLGDPTLRLQITPPVEKLTARKSQGRVRLEWSAAPGPDARYYVYCAASLSEPFERIAGPVSDTWFVEAQPAQGKPIYQVRVARSVVTGSGSFTNLSTGTLCRPRGD